MGKGADGGVGADVVFVCVGSTDAVEAAFGCVRKGGTVNLFGGLRWVPYHSGSAHSALRRGNF